MRRARRLIFSEYFVLWLSLLWLAAAAPFTPGLASAANLSNIFANLLPLLVLGVGQTVVLITGGIDLSVTSTLALASTAGALVMTTQGGGWAAGLLTMLAVGFALGVFNGMAVAKLGMPPFIVTLTVMMFFSGLAVWLTRSSNIYNLPSSFNAIGRGLLPLLVAALVAVSIHLLLERTLPGRWLYAVGMNPRTALVSGVRVDRTLVLAYVVSGMCAGVAAALYTARLETGSPVLGQRLFLDVIAAAVIGGTSLFGGRGRVLWTVFGVVFISVVDNTLNLLGLSNFMILIAKGAVILAAALLDVARTRFARQATA